MPSVCPGRPGRPILPSRPVRNAVLAPLLALTLMVPACGAPAIQAENVLFREASLALEDESYSTAISNYKKLLEEYPFSDKAEVASLNIAYAYYLKGEYGEAIAAFNDFERLYPVSPLLPFVGYTVAMCWLDQAKAGDRDPTASDEALRQFRKVASEFPGTLYADLAEFRHRQARENLAAHELVVGDYYLQRKRFAAAEGRYRYIVREYPETENAARAQARIEEVQSRAAAQSARREAREEAELAEELAIEKASEEEAAQAEKENAAETLLKSAEEAAVIVDTP